MCVFSERFTLCFVCGDGPKGQLAMKVEGAPEGGCQGQYRRRKQRRGRRGEDIRGERSEEGKAEERREERDEGAYGLNQRTLTCGSGTILLVDNILILL